MPLPPPIQGSGGVILLVAAARSKVGLTSNMDVTLMTMLLHDLKRCSWPPRGSCCLWLQPEAKIDQIDLRPQERFLNKAQNQLVHLQKALEICMILQFGGGLWKRHKCTRAHSTWVEASMWICTTTLGKCVYLEFGEASDMDTNAHMLTQHEFPLQCELAKNVGNMYIFWIWTGRWHGHKMHTCWKWGSGSCW